jgi:hypothetical protein
MGRKFKIYIDDILHDDISNGEIKKIDVPPNSKELTIKVMNYTSKPITLGSLDSESYSIRQNLISTITTYIMVVFAAIFFMTKVILEQEQPIFLYIATPFFLISIYYSTIGRKNVLQLEKTKLD